MTTKRYMTNVECVTRMMDYSQFGALSQAFIMEAISQYADKVSKATPEQFGDTNMINPDAWIGVAKEIKKTLDAHYAS